MAHSKRVKLKKKQKNRIKESKNGKKGFGR